MLVSDSFKLNEIVRVRCSEEWQTALSARPVNHRSDFLRFVISRAIENPERLARHKGETHAGKRVIRFRLRKADKTLIEADAKRQKMAVGRLVRLAAVEFGSEFSPLEKIKPSSDKSRVRSRRDKYISLPLRAREAALSG